jgi:hypothetical protein
MRGEAMTLLPWPKEADYTEQTPYGPGMNAVAGWDYEHDRAEAALQRLRVAVAQLRSIQSLAINYTAVETGRTWPGSSQDLSTWKSELAKEALEQIGEVPPA